ncbi:hypothetical protein KKF61_03990, partial [Patescibacteria group bacterium]|nr:hypothetical protein [Patescibacteria group bacterium]
KKINFQKLNNIQLARIYHEYYWQSPNSATTASTLIELISAFGLVLEQKIRNKGFTEQQTKDFMMVLASPLKVTLPLEEEIKFLELVKKIGKKSVMKLPTADLKLAKRHFNKYRWLSVYFSGQAWAWDNFVVRVKKAQLAGHISKRISKLKSDRIITDKKVKSIMKQTGLLKKEVTLFRKMIFYRIQIENYYSYVNYQATGLINQTAKRLKIALNQLSFLLVNEAGQALVGKIAGLMEKITIRQKYYLMVMGRKQVHIYTGQQAKKIKNKFQIKKQASGKVKQIQGICGHPGRVTGKARIIVDFNKLGKFKSGEILITSNTTPLFVPAIKAAKAVIADEGGVTCHAAIVSRELGIPCVINTQVGTKFFKDGDKVLVDAEKGIVRKL